jgi:hypothetical protein
LRSVREYTFVRACMDSGNGNVIRDLSRYSIGRMPGRMQLDEICR